ncbi:MAG: hypothetical protein HRU19_12935 [Pseudobacteriovorax sp.]|nr:hypothetical protein [Pseudobacteriovorax sp.]
MRPTLCIGLIFAIFACQNESKDQQSQVAEASADENLEGNSETPKPLPEPEEPVFTGITCDEQDIPSWEKTIKSVTKNRCERCHNSEFAWNGVILETYEQVLEHRDSVKERLEEDELTIDIGVLELNAYAIWFANDMPEKESDCPTE